MLEIPAVEACLVELYVGFLLADLAKSSNTGLHVLAPNDQPATSSIAVLADDQVEDAQQVSWRVGGCPEHLALENRVVIDDVLDAVELAILAVSRDSPMEEVSEPPLVPLDVVGANAICAEPREISPCLLGQEDLESEPL